MFVLLVSAVQNPTVAGSPVQRRGSAQFGVKVVVGGAAAAVVVWRHFLPAVVLAGDSAWKQQIVEGK